MSAVLPLTRAIFVVGALLTTGTGLALYLAPGRTEDYWAWTIAAEPSAAFIGAGYLGAAVALVLAARERAWAQARSIAVLALALTSLALLVTVLNPDPFAFGDGGVAGATAWIWLAVYVTLPPVVLGSLVRQERRGGRREYGGAKALAATRLVLGGAGVVSASVGAALVAGWDAAESRWPWPLTPLSSGVVGGWLCTLAVGLLWFAVRDSSWRRNRNGVIAFATTIGLNLAGAARLWEDLDGDAWSGAYVLFVTALLATIGVAALVEERRRGDP